MTEVVFLSSGHKEAFCIIGFHQYGNTGRILRGSREKLSTQISGSEAAEEKTAIFSGILITFTEFKKILRKTRFIQWNEVF